MKANFSLLLGVVIVFSMEIASCKRNDAKSSTKTAQDPIQREGLTKFSSKAEFEQKLVLGVETNSLISCLGRPDSVQRLDEDTQLWNYRLQPFATGKSADGDYITHVLGLNARITNGHLAYWGFVSANLPNVEHSQIQALESTTNLADTLEIEFYVVSPEEIPDGRFVNTVRFPNLGFTTTSPVLRIRTVERITIKERTTVGDKNETNRHWLVAVELAKKDAVEFGMITQTNLGKRLLIMLDKEPVSCATVTLPIESGAFEFVCSDSNLLEFIRKRLRPKEK